MGSNDYGGSREQRETDKSQLGTLSLIYYILAALNTLSTLMGFLAFLGIGILLFLSIGVFLASVEDANAGSTAPPTVLGFILIGLSVLWLLVGGVWAYLMYLTGRSLKERKRRTLCFVMACLLCLQPPLMTILGIFTIIVLRRPSVQELFARNEAV